MISGINRTRIPGLNNMRINKSYPQMGATTSNKSILNSVSNNNIAANSSYSQRMQFLNGMFGLNAVSVNNKLKDTKGVDVLSVNIDTEKKLHNKVLNLKVDQLATVQKNTSKQLLSKSKDISANSYEFQITSKDKSFKVKVDIKEGDTTEDVLNKIASSVTSLNCGVKSEIAKNKENAISLTLVSSETGSKSSFKISDLHGDLISKLKLNNINQSCGDAIYSVDKNIYQSPTNDISLEGNAVKLKLNSTGNFDIDINKKKCYEDIKSNVNEITSHLDYLVNHYNNKVNSLPKNHFTYQKLTNELKNRQSAFNKIGINTSKDNNMKFHDKHFRELAHSNPNLLMSSMSSQNGVLNYFNMVRSSDLDRSSSSYGGRGNNVGMFNSGSLVNYI